MTGGVHSFAAGIVLAYSGRRLLANKGSVSGR